MGKGPIERSKGASSRSVSPRKEQLVGGKWWVDPNKEGKASNSSSPVFSAGEYEVKESGYNAVGVDNNEDR